MIQDITSQQAYLRPGYAGGGLLLSGEKSSRSMLSSPRFSKPLGGGERDSLSGAVSVCVITGGDTVMRLKKHDQHRY